ncbi:hypothetical protein AKN40_1066 [Escherichia coli]|nr:hypothetical protein AKN40_1066 [Escherichia coli]KGM62618.1 hypothetical protein EL76_1084 [Escherichia coli G3/10]
MPPKIIKSPAAVYPRWRGEHILSDKQKDIIPGLSPLARGTHIFYLPL